MTEMVEILKIIWRQDRKIKELEAILSGKERKHD